MKVAVFFQKHSKSKLVGLIKLGYIKCFLRSNKRRIQYLRDAGAQIGKGVNLQSIAILGTEPYLVKIGDNVYFSGVETRIFTHDGSVERLFYMGIAPKRYDIFGKVKIGNNLKEQY